MLLDKKICILCGHYGKGTGASTSEIDEFTENALCSLALMIRLASLGYDIEILTIQDINKDGNKDVTRRQVVMGKSSADLFVCIHHNSVDSPSARGSELLYFGDESIGLLDKVAEGIELELGIPYRGPKYRPDIAVLKKAKAMRKPVVYIECGFITNQDDAAHISHSSWSDRVATVLANGIEKYLFPE
jgi:N-acetylmuramoyl-L-alanine amidase